MNLILPGNNIDLLRGMYDNSVHAVVTDPPYGLSFMGKKWDYDVPRVEFWREVYRVLRPGGHVLCFGGTRTYHRVAVAIEDAGFEIRDSIHWMYGSGFPKSLDVSKALDKAAGAEREVVGYNASRARPNRLYEAGALGNVGGTGKVSDRTDNGATLTAPVTDAARQWAGWGTALKPAHEPIIVARKPLEGTVAENVAKWGTGALNIDGCRVATTDKYSYPNGAGGNSFTVAGGVDGTRTKPVESNPQGRWPPNILLTHSLGCSEGACVEGCPCAALDAQSGKLTSGGGRKNTRNSQGVCYGAPYSPNDDEFSGDSGGASRFFPVLNYSEDDDLGGHAPFLYVAKASRSEREAGCDALPARSGAEAVDRDEGSAGAQSPRAGAGRTAGAVRNHHPTVKPVAVMRWLVRLVTPPGGLVLDPFCGSGTTGIACAREGVSFIGMEMEPEYVAIAEARIAHAM